MDPNQDHVPTDGSDSGKPKDSAPSIFTTLQE